MEYSSDRSLKRYCARICNRVVHVYKFSLKYAEIYHVPCLNGIEFRIIWRWIFVKLTLNNTKRKTCSVDRNVYLGEDVGNCSNVVLVPVGYKYSADFICVFYEI